ncbi:MAG TPA: hydrogenase nickel incorporation protein HypB [Bacteroidales bacterium]|nr:hydrogenase nickel incorporation protein HypB [Bacteroidales bacterium]HSA42410.1 hydrogenase nickel incorporation protein HypB [Bacteroidales bacterium]
MCETCGCGLPGEEATISRPDVDSGHHEHGETAAHHHERPHKSGLLQLEQDVLRKNSLLAERNRGYFEALGIKVINLMSAPGSGKTSLLEKTLAALKDELPAGVIEGDQQTLLDAERIMATGVPVIQVNTGNGCHLDAAMVAKAMKEGAFESVKLMFIENVGNLVCPSLFDLGEDHRVVLFSVTEGDDKPLKYPTMFMSADVCIISKTDLLPYVDFDIEVARTNLMQVNHHLKVFELSVKQEESLMPWIGWLKGMKSS